MSDKKGKKGKTSKRIDFGWAYGLGLESGHSFPDGAYGELLEGFETKDVVKKTVPDLKEFLEGKKAWDLYISIMTELQDDKGFWGYKEKQTAETLQKHEMEFKKLGINTFFCCQLVGIDGYYVTFKWVVYVDTDITPDYVPKKVYKDHGCIVM